MGKEEKVDIVGEGNSSLLVDIVMPYHWADEDARAGGR